MWPAWFRPGGLTEAFQVPGHVAGDLGDRNLHPGGSGVVAEAPQNGRRGEIHPPTSPQVDPEVVHIRLGGQRVEDLTLQPGRRGEPQNPTRFEVKDGPVDSPRHVDSQLPPQVQT